MARCCRCKKEGFHTEDLTEGLKLCRDCVDDVAVSLVKQGRSDVVYKGVIARLIRSGRITEVDLERDEGSNPRRYED